MEINDKIFGTYKVTTDAKKVGDELEKIEGKRKENLNKEVLSTIYSCMDLTSLNTTDSKEYITAFVNDNVNKIEEEGIMPNVASICVYPSHIETVKDILTSDTKITAVCGGFPNAQTFIEVKIAETGLAIASGADEIDIVIDLGKYYDKNYTELVEELTELKYTAKNGIFKVIIETGALKSLDEVKETSILALAANADFIKTSTGKVYQGATPESVFVMCQVIKEHLKKTGERKGIKISGGIRTTEEAIKYYTIVKEILGEEQIKPEYFRIGASSLAKAIEEKYKTMIN